MIVFVSGSSKLKKLTEEMWETDEAELEHYTRRFSTWISSNSYVGVYTCVETK